MLFILRLRYNKLGKFLAINVSGNFTWCSRYKLNWKRGYPSACVFPSNGYSVGLLYTGDKSPTIGRRVLSSGFWPLSNLSRVHTRARHALLLSILSRIENNIATRRDSRLQKVCGSRNNAARFICFIYGDSTFIRLALFRVTRESTLSSAFYGGDLYARKRDDFERGDIRPRKISWKIMPYLGHVGVEEKGN